MYVYTYYHVADGLQTIQILSTIIHMSKHNQINKGIPDGFGRRLKEERKRLGLSQVNLARIGGVQRLAQLQYENENTSPNMRYLNLISQAGIDLSYLLLGAYDKTTDISFDRLQIIENKTFDLIEKYAKAEDRNIYSTETFKMLFKIIRGLLIQVEEGKLSEDVDVLSIAQNRKV